MENVLKQYDKLLKCKRNMDGSITVFRKSPFCAEKTHELFKIKNQFTGSARWLRAKLIKMDTTRNDIVGDALRHNWAMRNERRDTRMHQSVVDFISKGGDTFIN